MLSCTKLTNMNKKQELEYTLGFLKAIQNKLSNDRFLSIATEKTIAFEKKKESETIEKITFKDLHTMLDLL